MTSHDAFYSNDPDDKKRMMTHLVTGLLDELLHTAAIMAKGDPDAAVNSPAYDAIGRTVAANVSDAVPHLGRADFTLRLATELGQRWVHVMQAFARADLDAAEGFHRALASERWFTGEMLDLTLPKAPINEGDPLL